MAFKPFSNEAVMIIAAKVGQETRDHAPEDAGFAVTCHDCGAALLASQRTTKLALANPARKNRPLWYFCWDCAHHYNTNSADEIHDHRGGKDVRVK
ncbi:MAG TPA: hypothetical protein VGH74_15535 [Planctomycetaceae bacterium]|jgi:hypothetical protein